MSHLSSSRGNKLGPSKLYHSVVGLGYHGGTQSEGTTTEGLPPVVDYHGVTNFGVDYYGVTNFELDYHGGTHGTRTLMRKQKSFQLFKILLAENKSGKVTFSLTSLIN